MVTGESHYVWGVRHRLKVIERPGRAHVSRSTAIDSLLYVTGRHRHRRTRRAFSTAGTASSSRPHSRR